MTIRRGQTTVVGMKRGEFIQAVAAVGLGSRVVAAGNQIASPSQRIASNAAREPHIVGKLGH